MNTKPLRWALLSGSVLAGAALLLHAGGMRPDFSDVKNVITGTAAFDSYKT